MPSSFSHKSAPTCGEQGVLHAPTGCFSSEKHQFEPRHNGKKCSVCVWYCRWAAFALALVASLASAIPIVYVCRLPQCGKRMGAPQPAPS